MPIVIECGKRWALAVYAGVSLLALLLVTDPESKLLFVCFFGYYPVVKAWAESRRTRLAEWLCKFMLFNVAVVVAYVILSAVGFSLNVFAVKGIALPLWAFLLGFLAMGNVVFFLYDMVLSRLLPLYFQRVRPLFGRLFY